MSDNQQKQSSNQGQSNASQKPKAKNPPPPIKFENTVHLRNDGKNA